MSRIQQVWVTSWTDWQLWPTTDLCDWSAVHGKRWHNHYEREGQPPLDFDCRYYDPYSAYIQVQEGLPRGHKEREPRFINNVACVPTEKVQRRMAADLEALARDGCKVVWWDHAIQCFPLVAARMRELFPLTLLNFADDMPGSSELKTFPSARYFDVLMHSMFLWDFTSGRSVPDVYREQGLGDCRFIPVGPSQSVGASMRDNPAEGEARFATKLDALGAGACPLGLVYVGNIGSAPWRSSFVGSLNHYARELDAHGIVTRLHGTAMRDGRWAGDVATLYAQAAMGVNAQESSIFNQRLFDLWLCGVVQLVHDPHGELARFGFRDGEHFIAFDGTATNLLTTVERWIGRRADLVAMAIAARTACLDFLAARTWARAYGDVFFDYAERLR